MGTEVKCRYCVSVDAALLNCPESRRSFMAGLMAWLAFQARHGLAELQVADALSLFNFPTLPAALYQTTRLAGSLHLCEWLHQALTILHNSCQRSSMPSVRILQLQC